MAKSTNAFDEFDAKPKKPNPFDEFDSGSNSGPKATAGDYAAAMSNAVGEGVFGIQGGIGSFAQAPGANTLSVLVGGAALADRGVTAAANFVAPGSAKLNEALQGHAQMASRFAADTRAENVDAEGGSILNPRTALARAGLALQNDARARSAEVQADNAANNPELVRQQQAVAEAEGFLPTAKAMVQNPLATTYTLARSAPDMVVGLGAAKVAASRVMSGAGAAADAAAARVAAAGGDTAAQAAAAQAAVAQVGTKAVSKASTAGMLSEAVSSGNSSREGVYQGVMAIPEEKLATLPRYQAVLRETGGDAARARQMLANELADQAPMLAAVGTAAGTLIANRLFGGDTTAKAVVGNERLTAREVGKNVVQEGAEEGLQGVPEDLAQFGATSQADPTKKFDLGGSLAQNMIAGSLMGGGGTGGRYAQQRLQGAARFMAPGQKAPTPGPAAETGSADPVPAAELLGAVEEVQPTTAAEKSLMAPRALTTLDRVNAIDAELGSKPADAPGVAELQAERTALTKDWPLAVPGAPASFTTEAGARVEARYSLVDADSLVTSHDESLRANPAYPQELQPRARDRAASAAQISGIVQKLDPARLGLSADAANGAPIIGADGLVESGNARTIALKRIYSANGVKADDYKAFLTQNAAQFGLTPEAVGSMAKPVLVRVRTTPVNRAEFARQANASTVAQMSPSEQARSDANRVDSMDDLRPDDSGEFTTSRDFIKRFMSRLPMTEQAGMIDAGGQLSSTGYARVRNAVLAKAYGDSPVLVRMVESMDDNARNITKALMIAAPRVAQARQAIGDGARHDADITPHLVEAAQEIGRLKDAGTSVSDALAQIGLMGETYSPETATMLQFLTDNARRPRRIADFIAAYYDALDAVGDPRQESMFGAAEAPAKGDLIAAARRTTEDPNGQPSAQDTQRGVDRETAPVGGSDAAKPADAAGDRGGNQGNGPAGAGGEWEAFGPETGTLGIPRAEMPQVKGQHRGALINFLEARGIGHENDVVPAKSLKPTQAEYSRAKVDKFVESGAVGERSVMVSSDGHVLDGHHQWLGHAERGEQIPVIRLNAPIQQLLDVVNQFPSVQRSEGATSARDAVRQEFTNALGDLAQIASQFSRATMVPENTPDLMPTLVRLFKAGIKEVGFGMKDLLAYVKASVKNDPRLKTFWNKIGNDLYQKAAREAVDQLENAPVVAMIEGREYDMARDNFKPPSTDTFLANELLDLARGYIKKFLAEAPPVQIEPQDRARAETLLKPMLEAAGAVKGTFDQKVVDIAKRTGSMGQLLADLKKIGRGAEKLVEEGFDTNKMRDLLRATIVVSSYDDAQAVVDEIRREFEVVPGRIKNRTDRTITGSNVSNDGFLPSGYGDVLLNVRIDGVQAEIQINIPEMLAAKQGEGHKLYEIERTQVKGSEIQRAIINAQSDFYPAASAAAAARNAASLKGRGSDKGGQTLAGASSPPASVNGPLPGITTASEPLSRSKNSQPDGNVAGSFMTSPSGSSLTSPPTFEASSPQTPEAPKDEGTKLSRGAGRGMDMAALSAVAARIAKALPGLPKVNVLRSPADAPAALAEIIRARGAMADAEGAFHGGEIYLFASGLADELRAEHVLAEHEAGHAGLAAMLGASKAQVMRSIANQNAAVRKAAATLQAHGMSQSEAVEEILVDMPSAGLAKLTGWRKVVDKVRGWLSAHGFERMAGQLDRWIDGSMSEQERADLFVADLVRAARAQAGVATGQVDTSSTALSAGTLADDLAEQERWLTEKARGLGFTDIEDMLGKDYPAFERLAEQWRELHPAETLLSRAGVLPAGSAPAAASAEARADALINQRAATAKPIDVAAEFLTRITGVQRITSQLYGKTGQLLDRLVPERVKAGLVSDYGVPEAVIDQRAMLAGRQRQAMRGAGALLEKLATLTRAESRVAYEWMNMDGADPRAYVSMMQGLPEESVLVLQEVQKLIDSLSQEAVRLGQLDAETFKRHRFAYLRRSYFKHAAELQKGDAAKRARSISILGDQYKGRGMTEAVPMSKIQNGAPEWWQRKLVAGKADASLKGEKFMRLERRAPSGERTAPLDGMEGKARGRLLETVYYPAGEALPARYADWTKAGTWDAVNTKGGDVVMWRDFTKDEREKMGEIDEARYAIAKTLHAMIHDVEVGKYLEWLSRDQAKAVPPEGFTVVQAGERLDKEGRIRQDPFATYTAAEWVKVPDTKIQGTSVSRYGKLAGLYVPGPVWNDVRQVSGGGVRLGGETWNRILSLWKTSKTALSPAVHTNNIMSNMVMADWHDVTAGHVAKALRIIMAGMERDGKGLIGRAGNVATHIGIADREAAKAVMARYQDSGGAIGSWVTTELAKEQLEPIVSLLDAEVNGVAAATEIGVYSALQHLMHRRFGPAFEALKASKPGKATITEAQNLINLYSSEDDVFRLAAWLRAKENGATDAEAGKVARRSFLDYSINAPWVQAMRSSALPFISFTYRAVPMLLETMAKKPHKMFKLMALAGGLNYLGVLLGGGGDDSERKLLPEEKAGGVWGLVPKLIRMPWNDANGSPVYLDVRRWIPAGDVFDLGQGHSALPLPPSLMPGGPLALVGELVLNKTAFTGQAITLDTDTAGEKAAKVADYLWKAFAPNLMGVPGTYATTGVADALKGRTDKFGREMSPAQALASGFGVKLGSYPADVLRNNLRGKAQGEIMEIEKGIHQLQRQAQTKRISQEEFQAEVQKQKAKEIKIRRELAEKLN